MKKLIWNLLLFVFLFNVLACNNKTIMIFEESKLSPLAVRLLNEMNAELKNKDVSPSLAVVQRYGLREDNGIYYVGGLVQVEQGFDEALFTQLELIQRKNTGSIRTVSIPVKNLGKLSQLPNVKYIEIDQSLTNK